MGRACLYQFSKHANNYEHKSDCLIKLSSGYSEFFKDSFDMFLEAISLHCFCVLEFNQSL